MERVLDDLQSTLRQGHAEGAAAQQRGRDVVGVSFEGQAQGRALPTGHKLVAFRVSGEGFMDFLGRLESLSLSDSGGKRVTAASAVDHGAAYSVYFTDPYGNAYEVTTYDTDSVKAGR